MIHPPESSGNPQITDRRSDRRQKVLFSTVVLSEINYGRVLNISPNGLALQTDAELMGDEFPQMRFKFSESLAWVETRGRVAWRSTSRRVVGIKFIGLTDDVRKQIQTWIASKSDSNEFSKMTMSLDEVTNVTGVDASSEMTTAIPDPAPEIVDLSAENRNQDSIVTAVRSHFQSKDAPIAAKSGGDEKIAGRSRKALWFVGLALVATVLVASFFLQRFHLRGLSNSQKSAEIAHVPPSPELPAQPVPPTQLALPTKPAPSSKPATPPQPIPSAKRSSVPSQNQKSSLDAPTFVIQVGAMIHQENANALAASLREMNFPAFVMKLTTDRFHRVLVGPYKSVDATIEVQKELEKRGFQTIRSKWKVSSP